MVQRSAQGTEHGGISIFSPQFRRLFHMRQYEGQQPQFVYRWLLREILIEGVNVQRGRRVTRVDDATGEGWAEVVFDDGSKDSADLIVGMSTHFILLLEDAHRKALMESAHFLEPSYTPLMPNSNDSPTSTSK
jgi:hypothetical protein